MRTSLILLGLSVLSLAQGARAQSFDLRNYPNSRVVFAPNRQANQQPAMFVVNSRELAEEGRKFVAIGPFQESGELRVTDDNCPASLATGKPCGRDTGRTFGIFLSTNYATETGDGVPTEFRFAIGAQLFTNPAGPTTIGADGKKHATVDSLEQDRVSAKVVRFEDGYYVIAGVGAELLTHGDSFARELQTAFHSMKISQTKKGAFVYTGEGRTHVNPDASLGLGTNQCLTTGALQLCAIPQLVAQVSTREENTEVQASLQLSARVKATTLSVYGERDQALRGDGKVYGIRGEQCVSDRACLFVAVESRRDYLDRIYKGGTRQFVAGLRIRTGRGTQPARVGSLK